MKRLWHRFWYHYHAYRFFFAPNQTSHAQDSHHWRRMAYHLDCLGQIRLR